jgi:hypothetical protein
LAILAQVRLSPLTEQTRKRPWQQDWESGVLDWAARRPHLFLRRHFEKKSVRKKQESFVSFVAIDRTNAPWIGSRTVKVVGETTLQTQNILASTAVQQRPLKLLSKRTCVGCFDVNLQVHLCVAGRSNSPPTPLAKQSLLVIPNNAHCQQLCQGEAKRLRIFKAA